MVKAEPSQKVLDWISGKQATQLYISSITWAEHWGLMISAMESQGKSMPVIDSLICATAQYHGMTLVTRNTRDFVNAQVLLIDPWQ